MISVFTPAYNRSTYLGRLYQSLLRQSNTDFEWIIVDDGSTDDTQETVAGLIAENKIAIKYCKQINSGKHIAINKGLSLASGILFFIVDSDDYLTDDSLAKIWLYWNKLTLHPDLSSFAGLCGTKIFEDGSVIGGENTYSVLELTMFDYRYRKNIKGDKAEVFITEVLRKFPFPVISDERFCSEVLVWNRLSTSYKLLFFNEPIYIAEYLEGGLTHSSLKVRIKNPKYTTLVYKEMSNYSELPILTRIKSVINYWRFSFYIKETLFKKNNFLQFKLGVLLYPLGLLMYFNDQRRMRK